MVSTYFNLLNPFSTLIDERRIQPSAKHILGRALLISGVVSLVAPLFQSFKSSPTAIAIYCITCTISMLSAAYLDTWKASEAADKLALKILAQDKVDNTRSYYAAVRVIQNQTLLNRLIQDKSDVLKREFLCPGDTKSQGKTLIELAIDLEDFDAFKALVDAKVNIKPELLDRLILNKGNYWTWFQCNYLLKHSSFEDDRYTALQSEEMDLKTRLNDYVNRLLVYLEEKEPTEQEKMRISLVIQQLVQKHGAIVSNKQLARCTFKPLKVLLSPPTKKTSL